MDKRTCTSCLRGEPDIYFESSSGGWCYFCMSALRLREWQQDQKRREDYQWLQTRDGKPADMPRNRPTTGRGRE